MNTKRIILPKPVYELLPLLYLSLGTSCLTLSPSIGLDILGTGLIAMGLFQTILRINYRSPHQALNHSPRRRAR